MIPLTFNRRHVSYTMYKLKMTEPASANKYVLPNPKRDMQRDHMISMKRATPSPAPRKLKSHFDWKVNAVRLPNSAMVMKAACAKTSPKLSAEKSW